MKKILMIDPWGTETLGPYTQGICGGLEDKVDLTLVTNFYYEKLPEAKYNKLYLFFRYSEKMKNTRLRKFVRGIEYIAAYFKILFLVKNNNFDYIHIQWLLLYNADIYFLYFLKKYVKGMVLTAHNVLPHINGEEYIGQLNKIYNQFDKIIVQGNNIKKEFEHYFPQYSQKAYVQRFGFDEDKFSETKQEAVSENVKKILPKISGKEKIFIMFGNQFYNKGTDRVVKTYLNNNQSLQNTFLIIAGKNSEEYKELHQYDAQIKQTDNIAIFNYFLNEVDLNFLIDLSNLILMPYRHASMSGLIFKAAKHKKTALLTRTGSLEEYVIANENAFIVENSSKEFEKELLRIAEEVTTFELENMGMKLSQYIKATCSWGKIGEDILINCYSDSKERHDK